jgi:flagellar biosynthesis protein FlhF
MKLRRFTGPTVAGALARVREALGPDAMILETRSISGAAGGVEVVAAVDEAPAPDVAPTSADVALADEVRRLSELVRALVAGAAGSPTGGVPAELGRLHASLLVAGVDGVIAAGFIEEAAARMSRGAGLDAALADAAGRGVTFGEPKRSMSGRGRKQDGAPRVSLFFGPPGDGKTTTIAKLAGRATLHGRRRVALLSADTYRIGGAEELGAYARILGADHAVVGSAGELRCALEDFTNVDDVFIDTAGVAAADGDRRGEILALAEAAGAVRRTLVLSATTAPVVSRRVCDALADLRPDACIVTKIDAAPAHATLGTLWGRGLRVAYFGTGRGVPGDLEAASADRMAVWLRAA